MVASAAMRRLLVEYARERTEKRGVEPVVVDIDGAQRPQVAPFADVLELAHLLTRLAASDRRLAPIVELRFFGGLTTADIARALGIHERTVERDWQVARAWLYSHMRRQDDDGRARLGDD